MKILLHFFIGVALAGSAYASCPAGTTLDSTTKTCQGPATCLHGDYNPDMRMCESFPTRSSCPKGADLDGMTDLCLSTPACPTSTMFDERKSLCIGLPN